MSRQSVLSAETWEQIRIAVMTTDVTNVELAKRYGVTEGTIRAKVKTWGPRNAVARKRELVKAKAALNADRIIPEIIDAEADIDNEVMTRGAKVQVAILARCEYVLSLEDGEGKDAKPRMLDPKDINGVATASKTAIDTYRKIRGLDDPSHDPKEETPLDRLVRALDRND